MLKLHSVVFDDMHPNWHKNEAPTETDILLLVIRGKLTYFLNGAPVPLEKGDMLFIPYGTLRSGTDDPHGPHQKYSAHFRIERPEQFPLPDPLVLHRTRTRSLDYLRQRFAILSQHWFGHMPHFQTICHGIVIELLGHMARESEMERFSSAKLRLVKEVQTYIIDHYREPVRLDELAERLDRSPNYITQTYKEVTGLTPISYMHHLRMQTARELILTTRMTIGEASDYLGYSDQAYFNRVFKKLMGYPPSAMLREKGMIIR
ncbi:AraC family transcriptional regulator [Paenibacillus sp. MBLB4367]|uniref:AraC family transcriptional regulator n=1 Tax=Paenibacillus sp. MBLB4367 TaxID=3384767 RepID=UPI0039081A21